MRVVEKIKKKYLLISSILVAIGTFITFGNDILNFYERLTKPNSTPKLIQFALSTSSFGYQESMDVKFGASEKLYRTFGLIYPLYSPPNLELLFTIQNTSNQELFVKSVDYNVLEIGQVSYNSPKPLESNKTYNHSIKWKKAMQPKQLVPVYSIPSGLTGSFETHITTPKESPLGAGVIMTIDIKTNLGVIQTDTIQVYLPVNKNLLIQEDKIDLETKFVSLYVNDHTVFSKLSSIIKSSGLEETCKKLNIDFLEQQLMFAKAGTNSYAEFINIKLYDGTGKSYQKTFPETNLKYFWSSARIILKQQN